MKNFILIIMFIPFFGFSQEVPKEFRKMNTIIVSPNLEGDDLLKEIGNIMIDDGFEIDKLDRDFNIITTSNKNIMGMDWQIRVRIKDGLIEVTHFGRMNIYSNTNSGNTMYQMDFSAGMKNSALRKASDGVYLFAQKLGQVVDWVEK